MLVLSRKSNEKIQIGDNISITILQTKGNRVRIGIEAPPEMRVLRGELSAADELHIGDKRIRQNVDHNLKAESSPNDDRQGESKQIADLLLFEQQEETSSDTSSNEASNPVSEGLAFVPLRDDALKNLAKRKLAERNLNRNVKTTNRLIQILEESRQQDILPLDNRF